MLALIIPSSVALSPLLLSQMHFALVLLLAAVNTVVASPLGNNSTTFDKRAVVSTGMSRQEQLGNCAANLAAIQQPSVTWCFTSNVRLTGILLPTRLTPSSGADASSAYVTTGCARPNGNTLVSTINNAATDTQGFIARDDTRKEIIVALRGRSAESAHLASCMVHPIFGSTSLQDFVTDAGIALVPFLSPGVSAPGGRETR
jgi:hypothetical protein